jgi:hypothetical protein
MLITFLLSVDNWQLQVAIPQVEQDKHNGAVISPTLTGQFARRNGKIQSRLTSLDTVQGLSASG